MDSHELKKPAHVNEDEWMQYLHWLALMGRRVSESYAEHLARVTQDADRSKALLQAHYRALHCNADGEPGAFHTTKD